MPESAALELRDLATVHEFYVSLLSGVVGEPVPVPRAVEDFNSEGGQASGTDVAIFKRWLAILDLAISPPTVRDALKLSTKFETAESLLRYYVHKGSPADREKADFVATFLYRARLKLPSTGSPTGEQLLHATDNQALEFEGTLYTIFGGMKPMELPVEHLQLVKEFEFLHQEVDDFRHFDALMDSGIIQRARELKQALGASFYHPRVLATIAVYNTFFGNKFDELFREATSQIKTFASRVQQEGGSMMSRVEGDVMVKHLAEVEEAKLLKQEYGSALEGFRQVSKFKKAVDRRKSGAPPAARPAAAAAAPAPAVQAQTQRTAAPLPVAPAAAQVAQTAIIEDGKTRGTAESIRNFLRGADKSILIVALRNASVTVTPAEGEAFRADFQGEKSFRADYAAMIMQMVGIYARMVSESADYKAKRSSAYLWKPHADSLTYLLVAAEKTIKESAGIATTAEKRGLADKVKSLQNTVERLRGEMQQVAKLLQQ